MNKTYKSGMMALSAVVFFISCSESESLQQAHLSTDQINFIASMAHQWDANTKSAPQNPSSRSAGVRDNEAPIHVNANLAKPLYLHPVVQDGIHIWSKQGTPITRSGAPIEDVEQERVVQTRGSKKDNLSAYTNFGVTALYQNGNAYESLFSDATATFTGKYWNIPNASNNSTWPIDSKVSFHAYAPHSSESNSMLSSSPDLTKVQTNIHYTASSADIEKQPDLIVATNAAQRSKTAANTPVALLFSHALTAVSFAMSSDLAEVIGTGAKLTSVSLMGIPNEGDCQLIAKDGKHDSSSAIWKLDSDKKGTYTFDLSAKNVTVGSNMALTDDNQTLMMIPQTLPDGAKLEFTFMLNGQPQVLTVPLKGQKWEAGKSVIYKLSAKAINTLDATDVTYPSTWTASLFPKSSFTTNDAIGLYVVDKNNQIVENNVKLTLGSNKKWTTGKKFLKLAGYKYFAYYPYNNSDAQKVNTSALDASTFFADKISSLSPASVQNTKEALLAQDFQVAKGEVASDASTLTFLMEHAMGLAVLNRESKSLDHFYKLQGYEDYTWSNGSVPMTANGTFSSGQKLFSTTATQGIMVVAPNSTVTFTNTSNGKDEWKTTSVSIKINEGNKVYSDEAKLKLQHYDETTYTMDVGDIYYDNGGITKPSEAEIAAARNNGLTTIGIIGYLGNDYWTEKDVVISEKKVGGHALVMCLKTIGSTGQTNFGGWYAWYSAPNSNNLDACRTKVNSKSLLVNSCNETYGSGYTETVALIKKWGQNAEAAYWAKKYNTLPANSSKCTGWFLPSAGQYYAVMSQLGGGISPDTWEIYNFFGNMTTVSGKINAALSKVGADQYTEFFQGCNSWAWTSSEVNDINAVDIDSGIDDIKVPGSVRFNPDEYKRNAKPVRPFLAF